MNDAEMAGQGQKPTGIIWAGTANERKSQAAQLFGEGRYVGSKECAAFLGCGMTKFWELAREPDFPRSFNSGRLRRWFLADVSEWMKKNAANTEARAA